MVSVRKRGKVYEYRFEIALTNICTISYEVLEGLNYRAARLAQIPDEQYREMFRKYASSKTKTPQEAEMLLDRIDETKTRFKTSSIPTKNSTNGFGSKANFQSASRQQKRQQQIKQQQMEEEEMEHGMSM